MDNLSGSNWNNATSRLIIMAAGLAGALGVMAAAGASHGDSRNLSGIATICLAHGPALLALGLLGKGRVLTSAGLLLAAGTIVFAADLASREWLNQGLFPGAAPLGGVGMIGGWLAVMSSGVLDWWKAERFK